MALVREDDGRTCIYTKDGFVFPENGSGGVRVVALVEEDARYPAAAVFLRDMSDNDRELHGWAYDPLASWHFATHGTGFSSPLERARGLARWHARHTKAADART